MTVGWLLDANVFDSYHDELAAAVVRNGYAVKSINRPNPPYNWDDTGLAYRKAFSKGACVVTHADIDLVSRVLANGDWTPGAFATVGNFYCSHYFSHYGRFLLNHDYVMLPFAELKRREDFLFKTLGRKGRIFIRPDSPLKLFTGLIASKNTFDRDLEFMSFYEFPVESLVVVSSPKEITAEWRFVIANQSIVAGSQYKERDKLIASANYDEFAHALAQEILATGFVPDPVWVMDICRTTDGRYHLLEIGGFSFANLYGCNKEAVVISVSEVAAEIYSRKHAKIQ